MGGEHLNRKIAFHSEKRQDNRSRRFPRSPINHLAFSQDPFAVPANAVGIVTFKNDPACDATT
jgi:hypothetical protein